MAQRHLDRLSAIDATFIHQESATTHMHIGGVAVLEGPPPRYEEFVARIGAQLHLVPRYRQRLAVPPFQTGRPLWVDDPRFRLEYHVRHTALPRPGDEDQLLRLTSRIISQQLDRNRPLWELWLVEGLSGNRFAFISKTHHSLVDGVGGAELLTVLFELERDAGEPGTPAPWIPHPEPGTPVLLAAGLRDAVRLATQTASRMAAAVSRPSRLIGEAREVAAGLGEVAWAAINPAPPTPLNVPVGPHRRFAIVRGRLDDYRLVKNAFGGTVNDVVLCVVAGALARFLRTRGVTVEGLPLRACVPVSVRRDDGRNALGNQITLLLAPLAVQVDDPVVRLAEVRKAMDGIKSSKQALGASVIAGLQTFAPPTLLALSSRLGMSSRMYNLLVTNVPGPQFPVYAAGRQLLELFPVAFLAPDHALAVAIMSYNGGINFGLIADYDAVPDLDVIATGIDEALRELVDLARVASDGAPRSPGPRRPSTSNGRARPTASGGRRAGARARPARTATRKGSNGRSRS